MTVVPLTLAPPKCAVPEPLVPPPVPSVPPVPPVPPVLEVTTVSAIEAPQGEPAELLFVSPLELGAGLHGMERLLDEWYAVRTLRVALRPCG
jgi:hypothetical protein